MARFSSDDELQQLQDIISEAGRALKFLTLTDDQRTAVVNFALGRDVFVCLPTGSGKSVCFGVLPFVFDLLNNKTGSICIVVSPLIALMKDQVRIFQDHGVAATFCGSQQSDKTVY